jgi:glycosyltransferase involved in cell wall biosynthesis
VSDNAVGRADLLARLLRPLGHVEVVGPQHGPSLWSPVAEGAVAYRGIPARRLWGLATAVPELWRAADGDLLYASKPRLGSAGLGYLGRAFSDRPLLLDIDDWETGFFLRSGRWGTLGRMLHLGHPKALPWTWLMERLAPLAHGITVASRFLQDRFGGVLVPHVRDTDQWRPEAADPGPARGVLGLRDERVVMFLGTPRAHKGIADLAAAVRRLDRRDVVLAVVGAEPGSSAAQRLVEACPSVRVAGPQPFSAVPRFLAAADVVAVPQRDTTDTRGQVPAKLFDAMALGRPIVSTRVSMIPEVLDGCGLVIPPGDPAALAEAIAWLLDHPAEARALGARARARCVERYSFRSARDVLFPLVQRVLAR